MNIKQLTTERLATLLHEEFDKDDWGKVDPYLFQMVSEGDYTEEDDYHDDAEALRAVIDRVVARLKEECDA